VLSEYIEEDFRFATSTQVRHYAPTELLYKPHCNGYALSQLIDQIDGQVLHYSPRPAVFYLRAPGGTALWLARHLHVFAGKLELFLSIEPEHCSEQLLTELRSMPNVRQAVAELELSENNDLQEIDCVVLANSMDLLTWVNWVQTRIDLRRATVIAYDSQLQLKPDKAGHYFMNSSIWVNNRQQF
jgi:hypothetical protein